jgi:hypothetical protein
VSFERTAPVIEDLLLEPGTSSKQAFIKMAVTGLTMRTLFEKKIVTNEDMAWVERVTQNLLDIGVMPPIASADQQALLAAWLAISFAFVEDSWGSAEKFDDLLSSACGRIPDPSDRRYFLQHFVDEVDRLIPPGTHDQHLAKTYRLAQRVGTKDLRWADADLLSELNKIPRLRPNMTTAVS